MLFVTKYFGTVNIFFILNHLDVNRNQLYVIFYFEFWIFSGSLKWNIIVKFIQVWRLETKRAPLVENHCFEAMNWDWNLLDVFFYLIFYLLSSHCTQINLDRICVCKAIITFQEDVTNSIKPIPTNATLVLLLRFLKVNYLLVQFTNTIAKFEKFVATLIVILQLRHHEKFYRYTCLKRLNMSFCSAVQNNALLFTV